MSETAQNEIELTEEITEDLTEKNLSYIERMDKFKESIKSIDYFYLYKFDNENSSDHSFIDKYDPEVPPDEHEIGLKHGGGKYLIRLVVKKCTQFPKGTTRIYIQKIHSRYNDLKEDREIKEKRKRRMEPEIETFVVPKTEEKTSKSAMELLEVAEKLITMITPLLLPLLTKKDEKKDSTASAMAQIMKESFSQMGTMMRSNIEENYKMICDLQKRNYENVERTLKNRNEPSESETSVIDKVLPLISEYLPKLLGNDLQAKILQAGIKSSDDFKALQNDQQQMEQLIYYILQKEGVEKTTKLLDALGIEYKFAQPENEQSQAYPQQEPVDPNEPPFDLDDKNEIMEEPKIIENKNDNRLKRIKRRVK